MNAGLIPRTGIFAAALFISMAATAEEKSWSVTPLLGVHKPSLFLMNQGEFNAPLILKQEQGDNDGVASSVRITEPYVIDNKLPAMNIGSEVGIEFSWRLKQKSSYVLGLTSWEGVSSAEQPNAIFEMQGGTFLSDNTREAKVSYTQLYIGWRYQLLRIKKRFQIFSLLSLHELFDIDHQETFVFNINKLISDNPNLASVAGNKRIVIFKSQATGGLNLGVGMGFEFFVRDWLSLGFQGNYYKSIHDVFLKDFRVIHDFTPGDGFVVGRGDFLGPVTVSKSTNVNFALDENNSQGLYLDFSGWRANFRMNFHF